MNDGIELCGHPRLEGVTPAFRLRPVNHANGAFQSLHTQNIDDRRSQAYRQG